MIYSKCKLVGSIRGSGNSCTRHRGEFIILNDDTYEIWKRNGENMHSFKVWYKSFSKATTSKLNGVYPNYEFIENH